MRFGLLHSVRFLPWVLAALLSMPVAGAQGQASMMLAVRFDAERVTPTLRVAWEGPVTDAWTLGTHAGFDGSVQLGAEAEGRVTFGPLGLVMLEAAVAARQAPEAAWSPEGFASLTGRGSFGPLAARIDLARWTGVGSQWNDAALRPLPLLADGTMLGVTVDARASSTWIASGSWLGTWTVDGVLQEADATLRRRRALGSSRDAGVTLRVGQQPQRHVLGASLGIWNVPRRAPDQRFEVGFDVAFEEDAVRALPVVSSDGSVRSDAGTLSWTVNVRPLGVLRPSVDGSLHFTPSREEASWIKPFVDASWRLAASAESTGFVRMGVQLERP